MDYLRSCYETDCLFYSNDARPARIKWYFVPDGTPALPFPTVFSPMIWDNDKNGWDGLGEVYGAVRTYSKGGPPPVVARRGQLPCGTAYQFANGMPTPGTPPPLDAFGNLTCCGANSGMYTPIAWWKADAIPPQVNGTPLASWLDSSNNGYTLQQASPLFRPNYFAASGGLPPSVQFYEGFGTVQAPSVLFLLNPFRLGTEFAAYVVAYAGQGALNPGFRLGNILLQYDGTTITYSDPLSTLTEAYPPVGARRHLYAVRRGSGDCRISVDGITVIENTVTSLSGPLVSQVQIYPAYSVPPIGHLQHQTFMNMGEIVILPYAPDATEDAYWTNYLLQKWQILLG